MSMHPRSVVWAALALQGVAVLWEGAWHGLLHPDFETGMTQERMVRHLSTVHIPFFVSIVALVAATVWA